MKLHDVFLIMSILGIMILILLVIWTTGYEDELAETTGLFLVIVFFSLFAKVMEG